MPFRAGRGGRTMAAIVGRSLAALIALAVFGGGLAFAARDVPTEQITVPRPSVPVEPQDAAPAIDAPALPDEDADPADGPAAAEAIPNVEYDFSKLPTPVRRLREQLIDAAKTGDIERLRPIIEANPEPPVLTFGDENGDPIALLKSFSGDGEGREVLAILEEVLEAGYVHVDTGSDQELYVWPYFARYPLDRLTGPQLVELFRLITAGDYQDMQAFGAYIFYRVGITPDGALAYFVAGD